MKKILFTVLFSLFLVSPSHAFNPLVVCAGQPVASEEETTPTAYFKLNAAGGTDTAQIYDEIAEAWVGAGADTVTFPTGNDGNAVLADSNTDRVYVDAGTYLPAGGTSLTIDCYFKTPSSDADLFLINFGGSGDDLTIAPYLSSGLGQVYIRCNYNVAIRKFTTPSTNTWHQFRTAIDFTEQTIRIWVDGTEDTGQEPISLTNLANWGTPSGNLYIAYSNDASTLAIYVDDLKIYHSEEIP